MRTLALASELDSTALRRLAGASDWRQRAQAWEAIERAQACGVALPAMLQGTLQAALSDAHPGVRLAALRCWGRSSPAAPLTHEVAQRLSREAWPDLRLALLDALGRAPSAQAGELAALLLADDDARVSERAERVLWSLPPSRSNRERKSDRLLQLVRDGSDPGRARIQQVLHWIWKGQRDPQLPEQLLARLGEHLEAPQLAPWRAVLLAISLARGELEPSVQVDSLINAWATLSSADWVPIGLLQATARSREPQLAAAWMTALEAMQLGEQSELPWPALRSISRAELDPKQELWRLVLQCLGPEAALRAALERELPTALCVELLEELGAEMERWGWLLEHPERLRWLGAGAPAALRFALFGAAAKTLFRNHDPGAGQLLQSCLGSAQQPRLHDLAFQALAKDLEHGDWSEALAKDWRALEPRAKRRCAAWLPRGRALPGFRDALIAFGEQTEERSQAVELLGGFVGDPAVWTCLERWLDQDLALFLALEQQAEEPPGLGLERLVQVELRALARVAEGMPSPAAGLAPLVEVLLASRGVNAEIGKTAAIQLGNSAEGRALLVELIPRDLDLRPRAEACMALLRQGIPAPGLDLVQRLIDDFERVEAEARVPILSALGAGRSGVAQRFLGRIARESESFSERVAALEALGALRLEAPGQERRGLEFLRQLALARVDVEFRRVAIATLAARGEHEDGLWLLEQLLPALEQPADGLNALRARTPANERELLRAEVLMRVGASLVSRRRAAEPMAESAQRIQEATLARLASELLRRGMGQVDARLRARFEGREAGALEFEWRPELKLAQQLGQLGALGRAFQPWPDWERLDGALLLSLARAAQREPELKLALLRAALVALHPERASSAGRRRTEARLLLFQELWKAERWQACAQLTSSLLRDLRADRLPKRTWELHMGLFDRRARMDPEARLACAAELALGHQARLAGDRAGAGAHLAAARALRGASAWAERECARLGALLEEQASGKPGE